MKMCLTTESFMQFVKLLPEGVVEVVDYIPPTIIVGEQRTVWIYVEEAIKWCINGVVG